MNVLSNIALKDFTTMHMGGPAAYMTEVHTPEEVAVACKKAKAQNIPIYVLGGGSNVIAHDEGFNGLVILNRIPGIDIVSDDTVNCVVRIGAGVLWDEVVAKSVARGLTGIEALSGIPGTTGATPVQNIGAYGQEIAETIESVEVYDTETDRFVLLRNEDCGFSYRSSIFRTSATGRYVITALTLHLFKTPPQPPFYKAVQDYIDTHRTSQITPEVIRTIVLAIRTEKLPDPSILPNSGSFFKNAVVETWQLDAIKARYPDVPHYEMLDGFYKIPTGWLIEQTGLRGQVLHGIKIHDKNALVLINQSASGYADLAAAREEIISAVRDKFQVSISQEPLEIRPVAA